MPTKAPNIGLPLSYANRKAGVVHVRLHLTDFADDGPRQVTVRARGPKGASVDAPGTVEPTPAGQIMHASVPADQLSAGAWRIALRVSPDARFVDTDARVLVADPNPIALLLGPIPTSTLPPPRRSRSTQQKIVHSGGHLLDRALSVLPPVTADRSRETVRRVARRVLP
ncbi:MAG: hypothetical protein ABJA87_10595 [bacterium]